MSSFSRTPVADRRLEALGPDLPEQISNGIWRVCTLGDLIQSGSAVLQTGPFGTALKAAEYTEHGVPVISVGEIREGYFEVSKETPRVGVATVERLPRFVLRSGDIVFGRKGGVERNALVGTKEHGWFLGSDGIALRVNGDLNSVFLSYQLRSPVLKAWLLQHAEGSTMASLNQKILGRLPLVIPDAATQESIADVLFSIDSRIDLAKESNKTLEAMARAIFKSWFVDFDPVRAKAEGREPEGMDAATAALFPSEFQDSELGPIPRGWNVANVGDLCTRVSMGPFGSNIKTDNFVPAGVPVVRGGNLKAGFLDEDFVYVTEAKASELRNSVAYPGDIVITHRGTLGQVGLIPLNSRFDRYVVSQSQMLLSVDRALASSTALYLFLTSHDGQQRLLANTNQTGVPAIARPTASVKAIKTIIPSDAEVIASFDQVANALFERVTANDQLVRTLSSLRDTLLPRLISGKLRVPEAEAMLAEAL